jgi:hypothetical protein
MKVVLYIISIFTIQFSLSQEICAKVDSIVLNYYPWKMTSPFGISETDVLTDKGRLKRENVFKDVAKIQEFINLYNPKKDRKVLDLGHDIDVRMVIQIFSHGREYDRLVFDNKKWYLFNNELYLPNYELLNWFELNLTE